MAHVVEITDPKTLEGYRMAWNALFAATPRASFFHTYEWFDAYWRHFGRGRQMQVLAVHAADQVIGIVPLVVENQSRRLGSTRVLTYPLDNWGAFYSPIGGNQAATLTLAMRHLANGPTDWDLLDLSGIDWEGVDRGRTERAMRAAGLGARSRKLGASAYVDTSVGWESYLQSLGKKARHEVRRSLRRFDEQPNAHFVRHRPVAFRAGGGDPAWAMYDACEEVATASWQAESQNGNTLVHPKVRGFLRECHAAASRLGMVDMCVLEIAGRPVAFQYNYHLDGRLFGLRMGYREDHRSESVGKKLVLAALRDSCERGDACVEMGAGGERYKQKLQSDAKPRYRLTHAALTSWRGRAARVGQWLRAS